MPDIITSATVDSFMQAENAPATRIAIGVITGSLILPAGESSLIVTNADVTESSVIQLTVASADLNTKSVVYVADEGSFTIYPDAPPLADLRIAFTLTK